MTQPLQPLWCAVPVVRFFSSVLCLHLKSGAFSLTQLCAHATYLSRRHTGNGAEVRSCYLLRQWPRMLPRLPLSSCTRCCFASFVARRRVPHMLHGISRILVIFPVALMCLVTLTRRCGAGAGRRLRGRAQLRAAACRAAAAGAMFRLVLF